MIKNNWKKILIAWISAFLLILSCCGCELDELLSIMETVTNVSELSESAELSVHFIDVGQGDCILIRCGGHNMMIDAGENSAESAVADYIDNQRLDSFDYVVGTHAHSDHIGSLDYVIAHFDVGTLYVSPQKADTNLYKSLIKSAKKTDTKVETLMAGDSFVLGEAQISVLAPLKKKYDNVNNSSIVLKLTFGETSFLFVGDAETEVEKELIEKETDLKADVLKVGHHGSDTSSSYTFLREIMPSYAIIQVGAGNDYGHPCEETLSRLNDAGTTVYRNDVHGNIVVTSNGKKLSFKTEIDHSPFYSTHTISAQMGYIGNKSSKKFHSPDCTDLPLGKNRVYFSSREEAIREDYAPCGKCKP